ncbi:MAG: L,D-transpeptidase [Chloroflexota bacterium]
MTLIRHILLVSAMLLVVVPMSAQDAPVPIFAFDASACAEDNNGDELSGRCRLMVESYPTPPGVERAPLDSSTLGTYSFWQVGPDATPLYGGPGGGVVGEIPAGYNFVNAVNLNDNNFIQIEDGGWVARADATYTSPSQFRGYEITDGLANEFAFVLDLSQIAVSRYPGGPRDNEYGRFLQRYEVVNIFATAFDDEGWRWYMIGPNEWVKQTFVSKVQRIERPEGVSVTDKWVAVDLYEQNMVAYEGDTPVFATLVSSGLPGTATNEGLFNVWANLPVDPMSGATGAPNAYALQSVPWVMYFDEGISLHGSYWHNLYGYRQSRGCVNLTVSDARWLYSWWFPSLNSQGEVTDSHPVYVFSSGEYGVAPGAPDA